jgi:uncharacterized membrane protein
MVDWHSAIYVELSKTIVFYFCERLWVKVSWGIENGLETWARSLIKSVVYRIVATVAAAYWVGIESALWLALVQTILFVLNDRVWQFISWGLFNNMQVDSQNKIQ